ncbi:hypothetical protein [Myxococcus eversor]|uniref:hypothetical protein n=1 Tax=Myxococcus eversor TaxID=2709661 RepID=UPI0013D6CC1C|nr:hypothetical protein [Myxococcus eversor]
MTRNVKRTLAVFLLTLAPMSGATEPLDFGFTRGEYVSTPTTQTVELPARRGDSTAAPRILALTQYYYVLNLTGSTVWAGGTLIPQLTSPVPNGGMGMTQLPFIPPSTETYYYTTNLSGPAKTCVWQFVVTTSGGLCSGTINQSSTGMLSAVCSIDVSNSYIDPVSCDTQVVTVIQ